MAGHSHWKQIKQKKGTLDAKKSQIFSKLLNAIAVAAQQESNPQFNPRLRAAIEKAKENKVPWENIEKAIQKAKTNQEKLEEIILETYGPGGCAFIIEIITDNKNRTINEIKSLLKTFDLKLGEPGSVRWAFEFNNENQVWQPKFKQEITQEDKEKIKKIIETLENQNDVQKVYVNTDLNQ